MAKRRQTFERAARKRKAAQRARAAAGSIRQSADSGSPEKRTTQRTKREARQP